MDGVISCLPADFDVVVELFFNRIVTAYNGEISFTVIYSITYIDICKNYYQRELSFRDCQHKVGNSLLGDFFLYF